MKIMSSQVDTSGSPSIETCPECSQGTMVQVANSSEIILIIRTDQGGTSRVTKNMNIDSCTKCGFSKFFVRR